MSKKFFNLIPLTEEEIRLAPGQQHLKESDFTSILSSSEVLKHIKEEAENYRNRVATECESLKEEAERKGFNSGLEKWAKHLAELEAEKESVRKEMEKTHCRPCLKSC